MDLEEGYDEDSSDEKDKLDAAPLREVESDDVVLESVRLKYTFFQKKKKKKKCKIRKISLANQHFGYGNT